MTPTGAEGRAGTRRFESEGKSSAGVGGEDVGEGVA